MKKFYWVALLPVFIACANNEPKEAPEAPERVDGNENAPPSAQLIPGQNTQDSGQVMSGESYQPLDKKDSSFVMGAVSGGIMEVQLGELAKQKATNAAVKDFASRMVDDHSKANSELAQLLQRKGIRVTDSLMDKHEKHISSLREKAGADFDKAYVKLMVKDHEEDVKAFEKASKESKDPQIKQFATATLPVLQMHLESIKRVEKGL